MNYKMVHACQVKTNFHQISYTFVLDPFIYVKKRRRVREKIEHPYAEH